MKGFALAAAGLFLLLAAFAAGAVADPEASGTREPNPLRLFPATIDVASVPATTLWDDWHGREVVVTGGPFEGQHGVVQRVWDDHVQVAFPDSAGDGVWFREAQLELVEEGVGE